MDIQNTLKTLDALFASGKTDEVEPFLINALSAAMAEQDTGNVITILNEMVGFYRSIDRHDTAMMLGDRSVSILEQTGVGGIALGTTLVNAATACRAGGALEKALTYYQRAEACYSDALSADDMRKAGLSNNMSLLYLEMRQYDAAITCCKKANEVLLYHPEKAMERANTCVNLASIYLAMQEYASAFQQAQQAVCIFEQECPEDHHFDAALTVLGDALCALQRPEEAIPAYERAMEIRWRDPMGLPKLQLIYQKRADAYAQAGRPADALGMALAERDYTENFVPALQAAFPNGTPHIAVGLTGEGSECFGFDDVYSIDHDYGTGLCIFVPRCEYARFGERLKAIYNSLPEFVHGFRRKSVENGRTGVIILEDYLRRWTGSETGSIDMTAADTVSLATLTNGRFFSDPYDLLAPLRTKLLQGWPEPERRRRLAQELLEAAQTGQYNYARMMQRGCYADARLSVNLFCEHAVDIIWLLQNRFAPHYKWKLRGIAGNPLTELIKKILMTPEQSAAWQHFDGQPGKLNQADAIVCLIESFAGAVVQELHNQGLTKSDNVYLETHGLELAGRR